MISDSTRARIQNELPIRAASRRGVAWAGCDCEVIGYCVNFSEEDRREDSAYRRTPVVLIERANGSIAIEPAAVFQFFDTN